MKPKYFSLFLFTIAISLGGYAQDNGEPSNSPYSKETKIGLSLNGFNYLGDINALWYPYMPETNLGASLFLRKDFSKELGFKFDLQAGSISGSDSNFEERKRFDPNINFSSFFVASGFSLEWFPLGKEKIVKRQVMDDFTGEVAYLEYDSAKKSWVPYFGLGLGLLYFDPSVGTPGFVMDDFSNLALYTPLSTGLYYNINPSLSLGLEASLMISFSDRLDGIDRLKGTNDWITSLSFTMAYHLK
jgi:hypothetical protein